jgi:hypothetical protein
MSSASIRPLRTKMTFVFAFLWIRSIRRPSERRRLGQQVALQSQTTDIEWLTGDFIVDFSSIAEILNNKCRSSLCHFRIAAFA